MLIKNKYSKCKFDILRADYELIKLSKSSKERTIAIKKITTELLRQENFINKIKK